MLTRVLTVSARRRGERAVGRLRGREQREVLLRRAELLPMTDRLLLEQLWEHGLTLGQLARVHRVSEFRLRRRVRRLRAMLSDPGFLLTTQYADHLPAHLLPVARSHYVEGRTLRECAGHHHTTLHHVRRTIAEVRAVLGAWKERGRG